MWSDGHIEQFCINRRYSCKKHAVFSILTNGIWPHDPQFKTKMALVLRIRWFPDVALELTKPLIIKRPSITRFFFGGWIRWEKINC